MALDKSGGIFVVSVVPGADTHMLFESAIEGSERVETRVFADIDYRVICFAQKTGSIGYSQRIYVVVEADI